MRSYGANYPCKDCLPEDRYPACHDTCPKFLKSKEEKNIDYARMEADTYTFEQMYKNKRRANIRRR